MKKVQKSATEALWLKYCMVRSEQLRAGMEAHGEAAQQQYLPALTWTQSLSDCLRGNHSVSNLNKSLHDTK